MTTYKIYRGTHGGPFLGAAPTGKKVKFATVDVMRVRDGRIVEHWGVAEPELCFLMIEPDDSVVGGHDGASSTPTTQAG